MPEFRYEAIDSAGVPIHGTIEVLDLLELEARLSARNLTLVSATEATLTAIAQQGKQFIPRLFQLRFGELIREAVLTGMPVHTGLRALAEEPLQHPVLVLQPWFYTMLAAATTVLLASTWLVEGSLASVAAGSVLVGVCGWALFQMLDFFFDQAPRKRLRNMADRLENGAAIPDTALHALPVPLRRLMKTEELTDQLRAKIVAGLMPSILADEIQQVRLLGRLSIALLVLPISLIVMVFSLYYLVFSFGSIFEDFGLELPWITKFILFLGMIVRSFGPIGPIVFSLLLLGAVAAVLFVIRNRLLWSWLIAVPILGTACCWQVQSRVTRMLAVLIGNDCNIPSAIRIAAHGTQVALLSGCGDRVAADMRSGKLADPTDLRLLGVPLGILQQENSTSDSADQTTVTALEGLTQLLETAADRQSQMLVTVVSTTSILLAACGIGIIFFALVYPIVILLQQLV